ncbi:MAG: methionyl-tRNA formyltransferase [Candidatus Rokubacteria bacterium]|nr:methionyl-tRNA formyltransferase [Candidatus Rokubacteria bacterium]
MKVLFYGTPEFALPALEALLRRHEVVAVVTQPDRPAGRGQKLTPSPVKLAAERARIPVLQPQRLRDAEWPERLRVFVPEVAVVVAFGQLLPKAVLDVPKRGSINLHASLLPRYRGAAPIAWALIRGETETGLTTFLMDEGMDTGPILLQERVPIQSGETAGEMAGRLSRLGAELLLRTLAELDRLTPVPQRPEAATLAPRLKKEDGVLDWREPAGTLVNRIRGCNPWPGAASASPAGRLLIWRASALDEPAAGPAGALVRSRGGALAIATGDGLLLPGEVQPENRRAMGWEEFLRGARLTEGARLGEVPA